jgi:hypothetical protein
VFSRDHRVFDRGGMAFSRGVVFAANVSARQTLGEVQSIHPDHLFPAADARLPYELEVRGIVLERDAAVVVLLVSSRSTRRRDAAPSGTLSRTAGRHRRRAVSRRAARDSTGDEHALLVGVLNGLPSIVLGIFGWQVLVRPFKHYSALAGAIALAAMMIPLVTRATEEMIRLVPVSISLTVFVRSDGVLGRQVCRADDEVDAIHNSVVRILVTHMMEDGRTITPSLELLLVSRNLERVADLATNIGEDAVFLAEGKQIKHHAEEALSSS